MKCSKNNKSKKILYLSIILVILAINTINFNLNSDSNNYINNNNTNFDEILQDNLIKNQGIVEDEYTEEWLTNGNFTSGTSPWTNSTLGDTTDIKASYSDGAANYELLGKNGSFSLDANPPMSSDWTVRQNPDYPAYPRYPYTGSDRYGIDSEGFWAQHEWREDARQVPSVQWVRQFQLPVNMSDYTITSASVRSLVNGTVDTNVDVALSGIDHPIGDVSGSSQGVVFDHITFYIRIADPNFQNYYEIASYRTTNLGASDSIPQILTIQSLMNAISEQSLKFYLSQILSYNYTNFIIIVGMDIFCEDNISTDRDTFTWLRIKSLSLNFTYEKKIDKFTTLSWNQVGDKISGQNVAINEANLKFVYKINETWSSALSPNSEIRVIINNTQHSETIKLTSASISYKDAKIGGFDVTNLIKKDVNISLSIQLYLADDFSLNRGFKISIDNASLNITYTVSTVEIETELKIYLNGIDKSLDKSIEIAWRENINITVKYNIASSHTFIPGALVTLNGTGVSEILPDYGYNNYTVLINSTKLAFGNNYLTLDAEEKYFVSRSEIIKITVVDRPTFIDNILLNQEAGTSKQMQYNELLNISLSYNDTLSAGKFISGATVAVNGSGISKFLVKNTQQEFYSTVINTATMGIGIKFLTLTAELENYTLSSEVLTIQVSYKDTYLEVYIDGISITDFSYYNVSIGENLNITTIYRDSEDNFISGATVNLIENATSRPLLPHPNYNQYNLTINTTIFGAGVKFLTITASRNNYTSSSEQTAVIIQEKESILVLYLDGELTSDNDKITRQINEVINVTVLFRDKLTGNHLSSPYVNLLGSGGAAFTENITYEYYNYSLDARDLDEGITVLTVIAEMSDYISSSIQFIVEVTQQLSNLEIMFNGENYTLSPSIQLPFGYQLNLTVNFTNNNGDHINNANVSLGSAYIADLIESNNLYTIIIDTTRLELGINIISFTAYRPNYVIQTDNLQITLRRIGTKIETDDGEDQYEIKPGESITIVIELTEDEADFGFIAKIKDADVTYEWKLEDGDLEEEDDGIYEVTLENVPEGTYTITISAFKEDGQYEFDNLEITLVVKSSVEENLLFRILLIIAIIAGIALGSYLVVYQKYLKYPKAVRKVRKYRRTLKRKKSPSIEIISREKGFKELFSEKVGKASRFLKGKTPEEIKPEDKALKKKSEEVPAEKPIKVPEKGLTKKSIEIDKK